MKGRALAVASLIVTFASPFAMAQAVDDQVQPIMTRVTNSCADGIIQSRIQTLYYSNPVLKNFNIEVLSKDGNITLTGTLQNGTQKDLAEFIASNTEGVKSLTNNIIVDPRTQRGEKPFGGFQKISDATSTALIKTALIANPSLKARNIKVSTINGVVTLQGVVNSSNEKLLAARIAADTLGVSTVKNELVISNNK